MASTKIFQLCNGLRCKNFYFVNFQMKGLQNRAYFSKTLWKIQVVFITSANYLYNIYTTSARHLRRWLVQQCTMLYVYWAQAMDYIYTGQCARAVDPEDVKSRRPHGVRGGRGRSVRLRPIDCSANVIISALITPVCPWWGSDFLTGTAVQDLSPSSPPKWDCPLWFLSNLPVWRERLWRALV